MIDRSERPIGRRMERGESYGIVLGLIALTIITEMWAGSSALARLAAVPLAGLTLLAAFRVSAVRSHLVRRAAVVVVVAVIVAAVVWAAGSARHATVAAALLAAALSALAPVYIVRHIARRPVVDTETIIGAICAYLIIGLCFAYLAAGVGGIQQPYFAQTSSPHIQDYVYFSYVTMGTLGYGDLAPVGFLPRTLAISEMLIGQLYLVTVIALIVANISRRSHADAA